MNSVASDHANFSFVKYLIVQSIARFVMAILFARWTFVRFQPDTHLHMNSHCRLKHKRFYLWMCARSLNVRAFDENVVHVPIILLCLSFSLSFFLALSATTSSTVEVPEWHIQIKLRSRTKSRRIYNTMPVVPFSIFHSSGVFFNFVLQTGKISSFFPLTLPRIW